MSRAGDPVACLVGSTTGSDRIGSDRVATKRRYRYIVSLVVRLVIVGGAMSLIADQVCTLFFFLGRLFFSGGGGGVW